MASNDAAGVEVGPPLCTLMLENSAYHHPIAPLHMMEYVYPCDVTLMEVGSQVR